MTDIFDRDTWAEHLGSLPCTGAKFGNFYAHELDGSDILGLNFLMDQSGSDNSGGDAHVDVLSTNRRGSCVGTNWSAVMLLFDS